MESWDHVMVVVQRLVVERRDGNVDVSEPISSRFRGTGAKEVTPDCQENRVRYAGGLGRLGLWCRR